MGTEADPGKKRYNLVLTDADFSALREVASTHGKSVAAQIRQFVELGVKVTNALDRGGKLIKKEGDKETELIII